MQEYKNTRIQDIFKVCKNARIQEYKICCILVFLYSRVLYHASCDGRDFVELSTNETIPNFNPLTTTLYTVPDNVMRMYQWFPQVSNMFLNDL